MNNPQINNNALRTFDFNAAPVHIMQDKKGNPWFVAKDVCNILGLTNITEALRNLDDDQKSNFSNSEVGKISTNGGRSPIIITESGLYTLVLRSRKPEAHRFRRWVTGEVLPQIRKTGGYIPAGKEEDPQAIMARAVLIAQKTIKDQAHRLEEQKPKVLFADALTTSKSSVLVGELAKILRQNGVQIGQNRLFQWLRSNGYLSSRRGRDWNMPTQYSSEHGLMEIKTSWHTSPDGSSIESLTPKVTGKGQQYFVNKFLQPQELSKEA